MLTRLLTRSLLTFAFLTTALAAQNPPQTTLQTGAQLVILDVTVQDKSGKAVHDLKREDFLVTEKHVPQTLRSAEEHSTLNAPLPLAQPQLPPGTFTDYTPVTPDGGLNILLLDTLNTPTKDQTFVRAQLQQYVNHASPGARIAIFGLSTHLVMLQGFTSDPSILKDAVAHKLIPRSSVLLDDPTGSGAPTPSLADQATDIASSTSNAAQAASLAQVAANLTQFEAQNTSYQTNLRTQYTLDAFNTLAHYLAGFPGRKNVLWFSGAFPIDILPDATLQDPFAVVQSNEDEFRDTVVLLGKAQAAIYPIDARGLMTNPAFDVTTQLPAGSNRDPSLFSRTITKFDTSQADEHSTMDRLAQETGGHAYYNTNGLADAVSQAIQAGANYYTLTYTPSDFRLDGSYHALHVQMSEAAAARGFKLAYRQGYYAEKVSSSNVSPTPAAPAATARQHADAAYASAVMARGAPTPQDMLFKVRVLPATRTTEPTVAPGNVVDPNNAVAGPFRRFDVDFVSLPSDVAFTTQADGTRTGSLEFRVYVYDVSGRLLNLATRGVSLHLTPANYQRFLHSSLQIHMEISAPVHRETYFRIALRDAISNRFGIVEVSSSSVDHLPPPPPPPTSAPPATTPSTPAPPTLR